MATLTFLIGTLPCSLPAQQAASPAPDAEAAAKGLRPPPPQHAFEFSDVPDFKVAGITDWTAVGGHGSDATLRTSEDLARDASLLKPATNADSGNPSAIDGQRQRELLAKLAAKPGSYAPNHELGEFYLRAREYRAAAPLLERAADLSGHRAEDEYAVAQACAGLGDLTEAHRHVTAAIGKQDEARYRRLAGDLDERLGDPLAAVEEEQHAALLDPNEDNYLAWASELLLHRAIWQAADVLSKGAQRYPRSARIQAAWGAALFAGALYDEAARRLCEASDLDPTSREPYLLLGKAALGAPASLPCATETLARFVRLYPGDPQASYYDAMQLLKEHGGNELPAVKALLHRAVLLNPHYADAYLQLGILALGTHKNAEALQDFQQAIEADPQQAEAHYRLGVLYDRSGRSAEAQRQFHTHEVLAKQQADAVERERRQVKQFLVTSQAGAARANGP